MYMYMYTCIEILPILYSQDEVQFKVAPFPFLPLFLLQSLYRLNRDLRTQETERKDRQMELRQQQEEIKEKSKEAIAIRETLMKGEATFRYNRPLSYFIVMHFSVGLTAIIQCTLGPCFFLRN